LIGTLWLVQPLSYEHFEKKSTGGARDLYSYDENRFHASWMRRADAELV